jgi:hypothetical protein
MKKSRFTTLVPLTYLLLVLLITGCSKNGANGTNGTDGTNGTNGASILSGTTDPTSSVGNVGDFYLNLSTDSLFGPKTASGWGTGISLKGATGSANVIYSNWNYATNFRDSTIDGSANVIATLAAPSLTTNDLTNATILVYFTFGAGEFPLPYTSFAGGKGSIISFIPEVGQFIITRFTFDNSASVSMSPLLQFRFIIIPGGVSVPDGFREAAKNQRFTDLN